MMRLALLETGTACEPLRGWLERSEYPVSHFATIKSFDELRARYEQLHPDLLFVDYQAQLQFDDNWSEQLRRRDRSLPILRLAPRPPASRQPADDDLIILDDQALAAPAFKLVRALGEARRDLRLTRAKLSLAERSAIIGSWEWSVHSEVSRWSQGNRTMFGFVEGDEPADTFEHWLAALHPEDRDRAIAAIESALNTSDWLESRLRVNSAPAGAPPAYRTVRALGQVLRSGDGKADAMVGIHHDLTAEFERMTALARSDLLDAELDLAHAQFATLFDQSDDCLAFFIPDENGRLVYAAMNAAGQAHVPVSWEETRGRAPEDVLDGNGGEIIQANIQRVFETGEPFRYEPTLEMVGQRVTFDALYSPVCSTDGAVRGVMINARDISEKRRMERSLRQSETMQALGQLSSGVAHDFNNLLASTGACLHLLGKFVGDNPRAKSVLEEGQQSLARGKALTQRLLSYARAGTSENCAANVDDCLASVVPILRRTLGSRIEISAASDATEAIVAADPREIELALINLAVNARDAMPDGGTLTIASQVVELEDNNAEVLAAGRYAVISVLDTGCGMTPDELTRATQPFFTTKPEGVGTGLGLSIVAKFVHDLGGELLIRSAVGAGTSVALYLPLVGAQETPDS